MAPTIKAELSRARGSMRNATWSLPTTIATAGAVLAIVALMVRRNAKRAETRHPATGRFINVNGVRLHYLEQGTGEPVVLLHGNGVQATDFIGSGLLNTLSRPYHVIAIDRPGFGYSERPRWHVWSPEAQAELLQTALAQLAIERPVIVAHSWGTMIALALALRHPSCLRGLLLISGYYYPTMRWDALLMAPPAVPLLGDLMRYTISPLLARVLAPFEVRKMFAPDPVPAAFYREVPLEMMLRPWQLRAAAAESALMMPGAGTLANHFGQLRLPVTIVAGAQDRIVNHQTQAVRLHQDLPESQLMVIPGRGHMLHYTESERLARAVDGLFSSQANQLSKSLPLKKPAVTPA